MRSVVAKGSILSATVAGLAVAMALYHLASTQILLLSHIEHLNLHLAFGLCIVLLMAAERSRPSLRILLILAVVPVILATGYIHHEAFALPDREQMPTQLDTIVGVTLIIMSILAAYLSFGIILPILAVLSILYGFFGQLFPPPLFHGGVGFFRLVAMLTTDLDGIYGTLLYISATYMAVFLTFGGFIQNSGAAQFFIDLPLAIFKGIKAAGGYAAVMGSALMGMGSGSPVANVVTTGTFTIPLMKRSGFLPHVAGAIEAAASTGGQIMPPVMGAVAFVMAEFTGTPYVKICGYALIPAIIYFAAIGMNVRFRSARMQLLAVPLEDLPNLREVVGRSKFFLPIFVLVGILAAGHTPAMAAFFAILSLLLIIVPRRPNAEFAGTVWRCLRDGGKRAAEFAAAMACISIFVKVIMGTGLGLKLPVLIDHYSRGNLFLGYFYTAIASAILGMGLPTVAAYIVVAVLAVPALVHMGATELQAHFFVLYFSILSALTPPVALAALAGSKLAGADYMKTGWWSLKFGLVAYLIPFVFAYNPALMAIGSLGAIAAAIVCSLLACLTASACMQGYFLRETTILEKVLLGASSLSFFGSVMTQHHIAPFLSALICGVLVLLKQGGLSMAQKAISRLAIRAGSKRL